jgi:hypothetical protein
MAINLFQKYLNRRAISLQMEFAKNMFSLYEKTPCLPQFCVFHLNKIITQKQGFYFTDLLRNEE